MTAGQPLLITFMVPGVTAACIAVFAVSRLGKAPSDEVQFRHKSVMEMLRVHGY